MLIRREMIRFDLARLDRVDVITLYSQGGRGGGLTVLSMKSMQS